MYYGLDHFYQNHRKYVKSRDDNQLMGIFSDSLASECDPFGTVTDGTVSKKVAPCGAIANSFFNGEYMKQLGTKRKARFFVAFADSITLRYKGAKDEPKDIPVGLINTGIAWYSDKNVKFRNPKLPPGTDLKKGAL